MSTGMIRRKVIAVTSILAMGALALSGCDASNSGKIDPNIPQGIYSEDQLYNLFFQHHQVALQILDLASEMLKQ